VAPAAPAAPPASIILRERHAHVTPNRVGFTHTGAGYIDVAQPAPDTVIITMTGVAVAGGHPIKDSVASMLFDLQQCFEISFDDPKLKKAKLVLEGRVIGLLRSQAAHRECKKGCGAAEQAPATATVLCDANTLLSLTNPPHSVACGENLSLNNHVGPIEGAIVPGKYTLHQCWSITASHPRSLVGCKAASAEFAPDPALDPLWISYWEPFHGVGKKDFGYQLIVKVVPDTSNADEKKPEPVPPPIPH
jgi:hypothetical protein